MAQKHSTRPPPSMEEERDRLTRVITRWNEHRLDLFEIALPNEVSVCYVPLLAGAHSSPERGAYVFSLSVSCTPLVPAISSCTALGLLRGYTVLLPR